MSKAAKQSKAAAKQQNKARLSVHIPNKISSRAA